MSKKKTLLIAGGLVGGAVLLVGALGGAHAFGDRHMGHGPQGGPGFSGGPAMMMRYFGGGPRIAAILRRADVNSDGVITRQEATTHRERRFDRFDLDKNGEVTSTEAANALIKRFEGRIKRRVRSFDENGDGKVTKEEFNAPILERFASRDANADGKLTKDELPRFMGRGEYKRGWFGRHKGPQSGSGYGPWGRGGPNMQGQGMGGQPNTDNR